MWPFKNKEQKERKERKESLDAARLREEKDNLEAKFKQIELFPGTLEEYNQSKGVEHFILDTPGQQKYVFVRDYRWTDNYEVRCRLVKEGCTALIHYVPYQRSINYDGPVEVGGYGVPVKRKE